MDDQEGRIHFTISSDSEEEEEEEDFSPLDFDLNDSVDHDDTADEDRFKGKYLTGATMNYIYYGSDQEGLRVSHTVCPLIGVNLYYCKFFWQAGRPSLMVLSQWWC